uniref:uncharacterized protein LOC111500492 n=1 Tax=Maylandia zebra TaxID=106582 RepID=UPI000D2F8019|nr:uncharacterized protein LOC111500492 [Maylandia zebra]
MCKEPCFSCPACTPDMLAVSVDGNRKLYRFQSNASTSEQGNFEGVFIEKDEEDSEFVKYIQRHTNHVPGKGLCGSSSWTAAKESSKKSTGKLDEEGVEIAVCHHGVLLAALNMFRGEIFAYPLFLQRKLAASFPGHITFLCSDVACKYFPYLTKVAQQCPELRNLLSMRPFLSVMHAKAHTWKCEVYCSLDTRFAETPPPLLDTRSEASIQNDPSLPARVWQRVWSFGASVRRSCGGDCVEEEACVWISPSFSPWSAGPPSQLTVHIYSTEVIPVVNKSPFVL